MRRALRLLRAPLALVCGGLAIVGFAAPGAETSSAQTEATGLLSPTADRDALVAEGRVLFEQTCSSCHGEDARGIEGRAPSLRGVGEIAADFYLRTNRMPLDDPEDQPLRHESNPLSTEQKRAVVAFVGSFGGPAIPEVHPERGRVADGQQLFTENCAGCHQIVARGGQLPGAHIPDLEQSAPLDIAEAVDVAPFVMPRFRALSDEQVDSIARYVQYTKDPEDRGGWGIGHIGPLPEGMVTWLLAAFALVLTIRIIGERTTQ